ncbi:MAG: hypothetical protein ACODAD_11420 [Planctomycetota bacterium]
MKLSVRNAMPVCGFFLLAAAAGAAGAQEPPFQWTLAQPPLKHWRWKDNCSFKPTQERDGSLKWNTTFETFQYGWTAYFPPEPLDFTEAGRISFWVKGDGSGHLLTLQLGCKQSAKEPVYYTNKADGVTLDFTHWREIVFDLQHFVPPAGRKPAADLKQVAFIEFFVNRVGEREEANLILDDIRVFKATENESREKKSVWKDHALDGRQKPVLDGSNVLPNSSFELDLDVDHQPDFWRSGGWDTGSNLAWDTAVGRTGQASARIDCESEKQRGSFSLRPPVGPGPWVFEAWFRTKSMEPGFRKGPVARLIAVNDEGTQCGVFHAYGGSTQGRWEKTRVSFDLPPGAQRINLDLFNFFAEGTVWWDDVSLRLDVATVRQRETEHRLSIEHATEAGKMIDQVVKAVEQLPADTTQQKLKKAVLEWATEDAQASLDAGLGTSAKDLLLDVRDHLDKDVGRRTKPPTELLPPIQAFDANPYVQGLYNRARSIVNSRERYKKGDTGYNEIDNPWQFRRMGSNCYVATWSICHPESEYAASPALVKRVLRLMQAIFQNHRKGDFNPGREANRGRDPNINRFCFVPTFEAYLLLTATYPNLILPSKEAEWLASARVATEFQVETYGARAEKEPPDCYYANMDVHYMLMLELAARVFESDRYHEEAERFCQLTADALYPDGAFSYHGSQNECFTYHKINVAHLARYWQLSGSELARETVVKSRPYYPYNVEPGGVPEYYTDCFWKHYWSGMSPVGPEIVAGLTGCPRNRRLAKQELRWEKPGHYYGIYAATFYRPDIQDKPLPDQFLIHDENIQGPRGRFGRWSFAGTTRRAGNGYQGRDTFVGGMVVDEPTRRYPLNAALQVVTNQYRLEPPQPNRETANRWRECRYLSQAERSAVAIGEDFATLTTRYRIQNVAWGGESTLTEWVGTQQWILTPHRLVGMLDIEPLSTQQAYSIHGRIRFGLNKQIRRESDTRFQYGDLRCRLHEHNYADVITEKSETFYLDAPERFRSEEIVLRDHKSIETGERELLTYAAGTRQFFTVEVFPKWSKAARGVRPMDMPEGLRGLELRTADQSLLLVHNTTDASVSFEAPTAWTNNGKLFLHASGNHTPKPATHDLDKEKGQFTIPAHSHLVLTVPEDCNGQ